MDRVVSDAIWRGSGISLRSPGAKKNDTGGLCIRNTGIEGLALKKNERTSQSKNTVDNHLTAVFFQQ
jgi:hypothetical protein